MFIVKNNAAVGWNARGFDHSDAVKAVTIPLTADTVFRLVHGTRSAARGHASQSPATAQALARLGGGAAGNDRGAADPARQGRRDPLLRHDAGRGARRHRGRRRDHGRLRGQGDRRAERRAQGAPAPGGTAPGCDRPRRPRRRRRAGPGSGRVAPRAVDRARRLRRRPRLAAPAPAPLRTRTAAGGPRLAAAAARSRPPPPPVAGRPRARRSRPRTRRRTRTPSASRGSW